ncbi:MAG: tau 95 subunit of transcription factor TFIIIC [Piccolia ochrophora]|nr:MAG: tau 95 subunit of transcription factor TFIIIC [Piccolia ochrophora]
MARPLQEPNVPSYRGKDAPWFSIPARHFVSVEHPCIVNNLDKALQTLGDEQSLGRVAAKDVNDELSLRLRPEDPLCMPVVAEPIRTNDAVLKITVPRRTGRKRKRGSSEPYMAEQRGSANGTSTHPQPTASSLSRQREQDHLFRSLTDNPDSYDIEPVGVIEKSIRFRGLSDFQYSSTNSQFLNKVKDTLITMDWPQMKRFELDPSKGVRPGDEILPPPTWSRLSVPFNYTYLQNPAVKVLETPSGPRLTNTQTAQKIRTPMITAAEPNIPSSPPAGLSPISTLDPKLQAAITYIQSLLATRPIWTRRAMANSLPPIAPSILRHAFQYCGYMFRSGPWREALVRYGIDPRLDPQYRVYQTLTFQITLRDRKESRGGTGEKWLDERTRYTRATRGQIKDKASHVFDGRHIALDGKVWQVCDISDPLLASLLSTTNLRSACHTKSDGWYHSGVWAKARSIMRTKLHALMAGNPSADDEFSHVLAWPDVLEGRSGQIRVGQEVGRKRGERVEEDDEIEEEEEEEDEGSGVEDEEDEGDEDEQAAGEDEEGGGDIEEE